MARLKETPMPIHEEQTPFEGGSYTRQPDGSLVRNQEPAQVQDTPVDSTPIEPTPVQE